MYFWNGIVTVILRALTGSVCDRNKLYPRLIMQVAVFVAGATTILTTLTQSYTELLTCFVAYAVADGAIVTSMNILALAALSPKQRSQGFGFFHFCIAFALAVGPPFGGECKRWPLISFTLPYILFAKVKLLGKRASMKAVPSAESFLINRRSIY